MKYDSVLSDPLPVKIDVPQGSVRKIRQCAVRPASGKNRCATRFNTWTCTFHHIHERFNSRNIRFVCMPMIRRSTQPANVLQI